jgi:hypothetical protein
VWGIINRSLDPFFQNLFKKDKEGKEKGTGKGKGKETGEVMEKREQEVSSQSTLTPVQSAFL